MDYLYSYGTTLYQNNLDDNDEPMADADVDEKYEDEDLEEDLDKDEEENSD